MAAAPKTFALKDLEFESRSDILAVTRPSVDFSKLMPVNYGPDSSHVRFGKLLERSGHWKLAPTQETARREFLKRVYPLLRSMGHAVTPRNVDDLWWSEFRHTQAVRERGYEWRNYDQLTTMVKRGPGKGRDGLSPEERSELLDDILAALHHYGPSTVHELALLVEYPYYRSTVPAICTGLLKSLWIEPTVVTAREQKTGRIRNLGIVCRCRSNVSMRVLRFTDQALSEIDG